MSRLLEAGGAAPTAIILLEARTGHSRSGSFAGKRIALDPEI